MKRYIAQLITLLSVIACLTQPVAAAQSDADQYISVSGALNVGTKLYDKNSHEFFGIVKDIEWGRVQVLTANSARVEGSNFTAAAQWFPRRQITSDYVTKAGH